MLHHAPKDGGTGNAICFLACFSPFFKVGVSPAPLRLWRDRRRGPDPLILSGTRSAAANRTPDLKKIPLKPRKKTFRIPGLDNQQKMNNVLS
jgi:hypothetical protein